MKNANKDIRNIAFERNVKMYQIAEKMGIHYVTLNNRLRKELTKEEKEKIFKIIEELKNDKEEKGG